MNTADKIIEAMESMSENADLAAEEYAEEQDIWYAKGVRDALSKAQSIADGF